MFRNFSIRRRQSNLIWRQQFSSFWCDNFQKSIFFHQYGHYVYQMKAKIILNLHLSSKSTTVRPRGTRTHGTQTSLGHDFKKGSKFFTGHNFGTWTSRATILNSAQNFLWFYTNAQNESKVNYEAYISNQSFLQ